MARCHRRLAALVVLLTLSGTAACGGDDEPEAAPSTASIEAEGAADARDEGEVAVDLPAACETVPGDEVNEATGLSLGEGAEIGDDRRAVCAFNAADSGGVGVTVGIEAGDRFDRKAETSEGALGPGEDVDGVGERATFFYSDDDIAEGVGGILVLTDTFTVDVSVQGLGDEAATREAAVAIAELALDRL